MKTNKFLLYALFTGLLSIPFVSCGDDDDEEPLPPIGGYNSADEVAAADLLAYWPLDGNGTESKSKTNPTTTVATTWVTGIKGEAANLAEGYLDYPSISALGSSLTSFSMSAWINVQNNGKTASVFLSLKRPNEWAGNINFMAETGWKQSNIDSLTVKGLIVSNNSLGWQDSRNTVKASPEDIAAGHIAFPNKVANTWAHAVITYDNATQLFKVYVNGEKISNPVWEFRGNGNAGVPLNFTTPTSPIIGAFGNVGTTTDEWNKAMTGKLDEIRVYKKALTQAEIGALYELEKAGR